MLSEFFLIQADFQALEANREILWYRPIKILDKVFARTTPDSIHSYTFD